MIDQLYNIFQLDKSQMVRWEDLIRSPFNEWVDLISGKVLNDSDAANVKFKKLKTKAHNQLIFITKIREGCGYDYHIHDCKETITIVSGKAKVNDQEILSRSDTKTFFRHTRHKVYALEDTEIFVEFNKF